MTGTAPGGAGRALAERIHREGPIPFATFMELALYGPEGFFGRGHGAGRAGRDFVTSPEVGRLFATLVARALDGWWDELGNPDPFFVVEAGSGRGRLAADVLAASPRCLPALRYVLVERSEVLRTAQRELLTLEPVEDAIGPMVPGGHDDDAVPVEGAGPIVTALGELPGVALTGVVLANELLDNLVFNVVERTQAGWSEVRVGVPSGSLDGDGFAEVLVAASPELAAEADAVVPAGVPVGTRVPVPTGAREWLHECAAMLRRGFVAIVDYTATADELAERGQQGWLRTYRGHERGTSPLDDPGGQDITADVPVEYLEQVARRAGLVLQCEMSQAEWLRDLGLDALVEEARAAWDERAHIGDLEALEHRSRVTEASALVDPSGLGAHRVLVFRTGS